MSASHDIEKLRHSMAHLLAHAVSELYPKTLLTIGPATKEGFFYDMLPETNFKDEDLPKIADRMHEIVKRKLQLTHREIPKAEAREIFKNNRFKLELIDGIEGDTVGLASQGDFHDLCRGGHIENTSQLDHFKLLNISGAYWRADRNGQALQRISGTGFFTAKELEEYEKKKEEALKYDHRVLGKQLDLFSFHEEGPGFAFFHPKGKLVLNLMTSYLRKKLQAHNYLEISTPIMLSDELWKQSGHYAHYKDNMYFCDIEHKQFAVKPMNCPGASLLFRERPRSFRELPLRLAEFGLVHRFELSGVLHGLLRVRAFTQDDGHIFCMPDQIESEVLTTITMTREILKKFQFDHIKVGLSTKPKNAMGSDEYWEKATTSLKNALDKSGLEYVIQEGEGAFYGPKIEFGIEDSMGRSWQCGTIQVDFFIPQNFNLEYVASGGAFERPVMIHRAIFGSFERFFAIMLEHFKGRLPLWLSPVQARVLTITGDQAAYAQTVAEKLTAAGLRVETDCSADTISAKIKAAQLDRVPWMLVIGNKEVEQNTVTLRDLDGKQSFGQTIDGLIERAQTEDAL